MNKKIGRQRLYNNEFEERTDIVMWDVININHEQLLKLKFISKNSPFRQGVRIAIDAGEGTIEVNGICARQIHLWEDTAPKEVIIKCKSSEGLVSVYNTWDEGEGGDSQADSSGMILEENNNIITYHCNDYGFETEFDKLVFSLEKIS